VFIDFAKLQFIIIWFMILMIPIILIGDHIYRVKIAKEQYYNMPHTTGLDKNKPQKLEKKNVPEEAEGEGDDKAEENKNEKSSYDSESESEGEESEEESKSKPDDDSNDSPKRREEPSLEDEKERSESEIIYEEPDIKDAGAEMDIVSADVNHAEAETGANFDIGFSRNLQ
jgi:hypothetical protein